MTRRYERVEVITGVARRRRWSAAEKLRVVGELSRPGASVSAVAREHDVNPSLLFKWRRLARDGAFGPWTDGSPSFVPVRLVTAQPALPHAEPAPLPACDATAAAAAAACGGGAETVEIALPNGCRLRVPAGIDAGALRRLVMVLKSAG
jgi:transposase